ncbi:MAG TPA: heme-binding domain-containing protein [Candidatus Binatia bacterium]|jgi:hypothetical protein
MNPRESAVRVSPAGSLLAAVVVASTFFAGCAAQNPAPLAEAARSPVAGVAAVDGALRRACYDCHSATKAPPWNAKIAFSYWIPQHTLDALDFDRWSTYDDARRRALLQLIAAVVRKGDMPPGDYTFFHPGARLSDSEKAAILAWATAS